MSRIIVVGEFTGPYPAPAQSRGRNGYFSPHRFAIWHLEQAGASDHLQLDIYSTRSGRAPLFLRLSWEDWEQVIDGIRLRGGGASHG